MPTVNKVSSPTAHHVHARLYGMQVTCLSNSEEELSERAALVPFLLQDALTQARFATFLSLCKATASRQTT